jgi:hypothetical protein
MLGVVIVPSGQETYRIQEKCIPCFFYRIDQYMLYLDLYQSLQAPIEEEKPFII